MNGLRRYKRYADIPSDVRRQAQALSAKSPWRQQYHIEPKTGFLNDPNGLSYFNGQYHLCYQWSPLRYCEGEWYQGWFHLVSEDLVHWSPLGPLLEPETAYDSHGPYSGSAISVGDELLFFIPVTLAMHAGNVRLISSLPGWIHRGDLPASFLRL